MSNADLFWQASLDDIKRGFSYQPESDAYVCLICGKTFETGLIYPSGGQLYEARKYVAVHIAECHQSPFHFLLELDKKLTGLTDHQKEILSLFYEGQSDADVAKTLGTATSTIRNHRFSLREKQKQAKLFLALMEILGEQVPKKQAFVEFPRSATQVDARFAITEAESQEMLSAYFPEGLNGRLKSFPLKEKRRVAILLHLIKAFEPDRTYTEKQVNEILKQSYEDYVLLRRCMIEYGMMDRTADGSAYWIKL